MKKFLLFLVVAISAISIGLTIYYFSVDNEVIYIRSSFLVVEKGDTIATDGLVDFRYRDENTTLSFGVSESADQEVLVYNSGDGFFTANEGGESRIEITTSNRNYPMLVVDVLVCDGSAEYPYIISTEEALLRVGRENNSGSYTSSAHYVLGGNITLTENEEGNWTPIPNFSGTFDGGHYTITNIDITDNTKGSNFVGFVSTLEEGGVIENLFINDLNINVSDVSNVGGVAGLNEGTIRTTEVIGEITSANESANTFVGGIAGKNDDANSKPVVDRCGFEGRLSLIGNSGNQIGGGVVGYNKGGNVSETYYRGTDLLTLENNNSKFGGIVGLNEGYNAPANIYDSYFYMVNIAANTRFDTIGGVIYENHNSTTSNVLSNNIMGNYYGGGVQEISFSNGAIVTGDSIEKGENGYLSATGFKNLDPVQGSTNFITYINNSGEIRSWDFDSVWSLNAEDRYPMLNMYSSMGSTYPTDLTDVIGEQDITTPQDLYDAFANGTADASYTIRGEIDFSDVTWYWGDESTNHGIPETFSGTIVAEEGCVIKNLRIVGYNNTGTQDTTTNEVTKLGLVKNLSETARIIGLTFDNVTIEGDYSDYVGVLAGYNSGADIYDITIKNVTVSTSGGSFGTLVGYNEGKADRYIQQVYIDTVNARNVYFKNAGGIVGENLGTITVGKTGEDFTYNVVRGVSLYGNYVGGVAGYNSGEISYVDASQIDFIATSESSLQDAYTSRLSVIAGGIVGQNEGSISDVYSNARIETVADSEYLLSLGGVVGYNYGNITRAYSTNTNITVVQNGLVYAGGIAGANAKGTISRSVVDGGNINTSLVSIAESIMDLTSSSIVGGIVGFDGATSSSYSISECAVKMNSITGFYAGGLVGHANGKLEKSYVGVRGNNVSITGFFAGGLSAIINGSIVDSYTNCTLYGQYTNETYTNANSLVNLDVSATAGLAVLVLTGAEVRGCYSVAEFRDGGVRFSTVADITAMYNAGTITGCIYVTEGSVGMNRFGTLLSREDLNGSTDNYQSFYRHIGSTDTSVWYYEGGNYPVIKGLDDNLPQRKVEA